MYWRAVRVLSVLALLAAPLAALAQPPLAPPAPPAATPAAAPDWQAANREVVALVRAGRFAEAEARAQAALALCPADAPLRVLCQTLLGENTGWAQARAGRFEEAEASYRNALAAREQAFPPNDLVIGDSAAALGVFYMDRQRWDDAAAQFERAVEILARAPSGAPGDRTAILATAYARLAEAYQAQGRTNAALTTAREAVATMTSRAGPDAAPTQAARATLSAYLRDAGQGGEAIETALAALRPETLALDQRVRLTLEAMTIANTIGQADAVRAVFDTTFSLITSWADSTDANHRHGFAQLALAGSEMALTRGDPDAALDLARQAKAAIVAVTGKVDAQAAGAVIQEARALLDQGQAEQAATLLTEATGLMSNAPPSQRAWMVRALMDAGRTEEARARLGELQATIAGKPEEQSSFGASLLQLVAQLAERRGDQRAALAAIEQAAGYMPAPGIGTPNVVQAINLRRDAIRLRAVLGDVTGTAAAFAALLDMQVKAKVPLASQLETRMLMGWFAVEMRQMDVLRAQIAAMDAALPALETQAPRGAAAMLFRLAELSLALPGGAVGAMAYLERARLGFERTGQSARDMARGAVLRGRIFTLLDRGAEAVAECRAAEEKLAALLPGAEAPWRDALACVARAELQTAQFNAAGTNVARLLENLPPSRKIERAETLRLLAEAQSGQNETDAADRTLRQALDLVADVTPRRNGLRAEIWGAISANLHRAGRDREARNAAVAQRQIGNEDNAGAVPAMQSLRHEATALLALQQLDEAMTVLDRAERLRVILLRADPGLVQNHDAVLARVELARGRFAEAGIVADRVIAVYRAQPAPPKAGLAAILEIRASAYLAQGAFVAAETAQREALGLWAASPTHVAEAALARLALARLIEQRGDVGSSARERDAALVMLVRARGATHSSVALARLDLVPSLLQTGKLADAGATIDACEAALKDNEDRQVTICFLARAAMAARSGAWPVSRDSAMAALALLRPRGDSDRPALAAPLLAQAEAAEAMGDGAALQDAVAQLAPLLARASLEDRLRGLGLQARRALRAGNHADAEAAGQEGLALITVNLPRSFAVPLVALTDATTTALLAQGRGVVAAGLWRAALARLDGWGGVPERRGAVLRGLGAALLETPDTAGALKAWQDAAALPNGNDTTRQIAIAGLVRAALSAGKTDVARARVEDLAASASPGAALLQARLRAEIAEEIGDNVSALLEWWRAASLAGEMPTDAGAAAITLLHTARAALAAGQKPRAETLVAQAQKGLGAAEPGSDAALGLLEMDALLHAEDAGAPAAVEAWRTAVRLRFGAASRAALAPELALAALEQRAGDNAEAAARLSVALGRAEQLRGRSSPLWVRIALQAAAASEQIGDVARAASLRQQAQAGSAPPAR